jgi:hypothetical protein
VGEDLGAADVVAGLAVRRRRRPPGVRGVAARLCEREHAVSALIDHELGGGLGDCMVHQGRQARQLRAAWAEAAPVEGSFVEDGNLPAVAGVCGRR